MIPATSSNFSRSVPTSVRSDAASVRTRNCNTSSVRSQIGKQAIALPSDEVRVSERPVTAAGGLGGLQKYNTNTLHKKRQTQDASYFLSLLQTKEKVITREVQKLKEHIRRLEKDNNQGNIETIHSGLTREVRDLEGLLADHNISYDKIRRGCDIEELESRQIEFRMKNETLENDLDEVFLSKQQCGENIEKVENDIEQLHSSIKKSFQNADSNMYDEYAQHALQIHNLKLEGKTIELEMEQMRAKLYKHQSMASNRNGFGLQTLYNKEQEKLHKLKSNLLEIDADLIIAHMDPEEAHNHLLQKVKCIQTKLNELNVEEKKIMEQIDAESSAQINSLQRNDHGGVKTERGQSNVKRHEVEIDNAIKVAKETISNLINDQKKKENEINSLLSHLNKNNKTCDDTEPTKENLKEINDDIDFRAKHLANSQQTMIRLVEEKERRLREVEMIENLESKILSEQKELREKMNSMQIETKKFSDLDKLQEMAEITKIYLSQMKERYIQRRDFMEAKVKMIASKYNSNLSTLNKKETWKSLLDLEEKLRRQGEVIFSLNEFVKTKENQNDYETVKKECLHAMKVMISS